MAGSFPKVRFHFDINYVSRVISIDGYGRTLKKKKKKTKIVPEI